MASPLYEDYEQDRDAGETGVWVTDLPVPVPVKIRAMTSKPVRRVQEELRKKYRQAEIAGGGTLSPEKASARATDVLARGVLVNWGLAAAAAEGVALGAEAVDLTDRDGVVLPFTVANALAVLGDLPDFRDDILMMATNRATFNKAKLAALAGNSPAPSSSGS